mmetsp:Transcript_18683/g.59538  ORF Transcript_18683/g.59538 Transcript_18683/m.59538 type:complete len:129 (-) Transcript_18683:495-881(-)
MERMTREALSLCFTSRYEDGSSYMYTSFSCTDTTAIANRCSSPPDSISISRSPRWSSCRSVIMVSATPRVSLRFRMPPTVPLAARGMWSTYCGLMAACRLSSSTLVKKFCSSLPRKYSRISDHSGSLS